MSEAPWTVRRLLEWTTPFFTRKEVDSPRLSAELLLAHVLQVPRLKLYTDYERPVTDHQLATYRDLVKRGAEHEPIAYLTGKAHFFNLEFDVTRDVLIPRPETETLVEHVLQLARNVPGFESPRILDMCTGSGCIAAAIAHHLKTATILATDISEKALAVAKANIDKLNLSDRVSFAQGDLFAAIQRDTDRAPFHLILSNPPYIPTSQLPTLDRNVKDFEPLSALDGGLDGLTIHRRILDTAPDHLLPSARIYLEIAFDQGPAILKIASAHPAFTECKILKDHAPHDRLLTAKKA